MRFHIASEREIKDGKTTDIYFMRTKEILEKKRVRKKVWAEFTVMNPPYDWIVFAGLDEVLHLMEGKNVNIYALPEGTIFPRRDENGSPIPVMVIEGDYKEFGIYETPILGVICQASGIATKTARVRIAAGNKLLLSFGVRRMHPAISPMIDRATYIGGCDGVSSILGGEHIEKEPKGTMPHALMLILGEDEAWKDFDEFISPNVPRIALIDTFGDEKFEALKAARIIKDLSAIRLDTPSSRRGSFKDIIREVRWELDIHGFKNVGIFISGGLDEESVRNLSDIVDGFGVGTSLSNAKTIDYAMDIVEVEEKPLAKRGKFSGAKRVYRCRNCHRFFVSPRNEKLDKCPVCNGEVEEILKPYMKMGRIIERYPDVDEIRNYVLEQLRWFNDSSNGI